MSQEINGGSEADEDAGTHGDKNNMKQDKKECCVDIREISSKISVPPGS